MADNRPSAPETPEERQKRIALELMFIVFIGLCVIGGFIAALGYDFVSARAPIVIMVPLLGLIAFQFHKSRKQVDHGLVLGEIRQALRGGNAAFNNIVRFILFMALLLILIWLAGHYIGVFVFMFVLMYWISREHPVLALLVAVGVTVLLYLLFEHGFNIELYRGWLPRLLLREGAY